MRSNQFAIFFLFFSLLIWSCKTPKYPNTAELSFISSPNEGLVIVEAKGYGSDTKAARVDAFSRAFNTILFKGLPGYSPLSKPFIGDEGTARSGHKAFFKKMFEEQGFMQYVTEQSATSKAEKANDGKNKMVRTVFTINHEALKRDLIKEGLVRKFGL